LGTKQKINKIVQNVDATFAVIVCQSICYHYNTCNFLQIDILFHIIVTS